MEKKKTYKIDIFKIANQHINIRDRFYFRNMSDDNKKELAQKFYVVMRFLSGTDSPLGVQLVNELINPYLFSLNTGEIEKRHTELIWFLMCIASSSGKYTWLKKKYKPKLNLPVQVIQDYYGYNHRDATEALEVLSNDDIIELAEDLGKEESILKEIKKELKKR